MSYTNPGGAYTRDSRYVTTRITADGRDGFPVESVNEAVYQHEHTPSAS